jgi:hypothetical protein
MVLTKFSVMMLSTDSSEKLKIEASRVDPSYNNHLLKCSNHKRVKHNIEPIYSAVCSRTDKVTFSQ